MRPRIAQPAHYRSRGSADGVFRPECVAATITRVRDRSEPGGEVVALAVFNPAGLFFAEKVRRDPSLSPGSWHLAEECGEDGEDREDGQDAVVPPPRTPLPVDPAGQARRCPGACPCQ